MAALLLRAVQLDDEHALLAAEKSMVDRSGLTLLPYLNDGEPWSDYVERLDNQSRGIGLSTGFVAETVRLAIVDDEIVGRAGVRHRLTSELAFRGGHIGYGVIDRYRRRGYATEMLRQCLVIAARLGIDNALVTCNEDNVGSSTVIERAGGILVSRATDEDGTDFRRYEIATG